MIEDRLFFSIGRKCSNGCKYCFSNFEGSATPVIRYEAVRDVSQTVIYPSCDSEILLNDNLRTFFDDYIKYSSTYNIFSFSTKKEYKDDELDEMTRINSLLKSKNIGEIKIAVSVTNKRLVEKIEPNASSYAARLQLVRRLKECGIRTSVIIKPILPFIPYEEYCEIVDDFADFGVDNFVTGELYIEDDITLSFLSEYMEMKCCHASNKSIAWLPSHPVWQIIDEIKCLEKRIICYIRDRKGLNHYNSDLELIKMTF